MFQVLSVFQPNLALVLPLMPYRYLGVKEGVLLAVAREGLTVQRAATLEAVARVASARLAEAVAEAQLEAQRVVA